MVNKPTERDHLLTIDLSVNTDVKINSHAQKHSRSPLNSSLESSQTEEKKAPSSKVVKASILEKVVSTVSISHH